jgi:peroxiredoxin
MVALTSTRRLAGLVAVLALFASGCGSGGVASTADEAAADATSTSTATTATPAVLDFTSETVDGDTFDGTTLAGKPTVFWFWAPWCPTCWAQISGVGELAEAYGADVNVVGVGSLDERGAIEGFAAEVSPDVTLLADPDGAVWRQFGVTAQSTYLVLDEAGKEQASGYLDDAELAALVEDLVG